MEANEINQSTMPDNTHPDKQSYSERCNSSTAVVVAYGSYRCSSYKIMFV